MGYQLIGIDPYRIRIKAKNYKKNRRQHYRTVASSPPLKPQCAWRGVERRLMETSHYLKTIPEKRGKKLLEMNKGWVIYSTYIRNMDVFYILRRLW